MYAALSPSLTREHCRPTLRAWVESQETRATLEEARHLRDAAEGRAGIAEQRAEAAGDQVDAWQERCAKAEAALSAKQLEVERRAAELADLRGALQDAKELLGQAERELAARGGCPRPIHRPAQKCRLELWPTVVILRAMTEGGGIANRVIQCFA